MSLIERDFELPGSPMSSTGILLRMQTKEVKRFYLRALLYAILSFDYFNRIVKSICSFLTRFSIKPFFSVKFY